MTLNEFRTLYRARISYELALLEQADPDGDEGILLESAQEEADQYLEKAHPDEYTRWMTSMPWYASQF